MELPATIVDHQGPSIERLLANKPGPDASIDMIWAPKGPGMLNSENQDSRTLTTNISLESIQAYLQSPLNSTREFYDWLNSFADPRVASWPLMSSPWPVLAIFASYLLAANYGSKLMAGRKAFQLKWALIVYNLYVALLNLWIAIELMYCYYKIYTRDFCQLVVVNDDPYSVRMANAVWWYFASKGIEFFDTMFFVLRKKDRQLTFLHKYHHSSMFLIWWTATKFVPGGSSVVPIIMNSLVHVIMYSYYAISALGPAMEKYLWWKQHLTTIQLIQFFTGVLIGIHLIASGCQFTRWMQYVFSCYTFSFIILFGNFYLNEYINEKRSRKVE